MSQPAQADDPRDRTRMLTGKRVPDEIAERLIGVASKVLNGSELFSVNRVAQLSGIPRATLYYYFSGRDDLVSFYSSWLTERIAEAVRIGAERPGRAVVRLERALLSGFGVSAEQEPEFELALLRVLSEAGALVPGMLTLRDTAFDPVRQILADGKASGELAVTDVELTLTVVFGTWAMVVITSLLSAGRVLHDDLQAAVTMLIDGLRRPTPKKR